MYDQVNFRRGKYPFKFDPEEFVQKSQKANTLIMCRVVVVAFNDLNWPSTLLNTGTNGSAISAATQLKQVNPSIAITIQMVVQTYQEAYQTGRLASGRLPMIATGGQAHPLCLPDRQDSLQAAMLNQDKIDSIVFDIESIFSNLPPSKEWHNTTKKKRLTSRDIATIIQLAVGGDSATETPPTVDLASWSEITLARLIRECQARKDQLRSGKIHRQYAQRLVRAIECSLVIIQEYILGADRAASRAVSVASVVWRLKADQVRQILPWSKEQQGVVTGRKRRGKSFTAVIVYLLRWAGVEGRQHYFSCLVRTSPMPRLDTNVSDSKTLRERFYRTNPAFYGELAHQLASTTYTEVVEGQDGWNKIPTFLQVVKNVIGGCVE